MPSSPEEIRIWIQAAADGEDVPADILRDIECCVNKSRELDEAKSCLQLLRGRLQRSMCPDENTRARLAECIGNAVATATQPSADLAPVPHADTAGSAGPAGPAGGSPPRPPRPLWMVWIGGVAAGVLITLLLIGGGGQDAVATDALSSLDRIDSSLIWRMPDQADETHYIRMLERLRDCRICSFVEAIPEPGGETKIRLIGAGNTNRLNGRPVASLFYEGGHGSDTTWRFIVFMMQLRETERVRDLLPHGRTTTPSGSDAYIVCEASGRCCIAWQDGNVAMILSLVQHDMPGETRPIDIATSFRNCDRKHTFEGCRRGRH